MILLYFIVGLSLANANDLSTSGCGTIYRCFQPEDCTAGNALRSVTTKWNPDCFLSFKFHPYSDAWYEVIVMETGDDRIDKIVLMKDDGPDQQTPILTCEKNDTVVASYKDTEVKDVLSYSSAKEKLKCEFNIREKIINAGENVFAAVYTGGVENKKTSSDPMTVKVFCMPKLFLAPSDDFAKNKAYAKMQHKLNDVFCDQPNIFNKIEIREDDENEYKEIDKIYCDATYSKYRMLPSGTELTDEIDARCVADAEYFCDYNLAYAKSKKKLDFIAPDITLNIPCSDSHPFFVIKGRPPIRDAEIKCQNHKGIMKWTYNGTILSKSGPEVYCMDKLDCHITSIISASTLKNSFLNENLLPTCQKEGRLEVMEGTTELGEVNHFTCNGETGKYYVNYRTREGNYTTVVNEAMIFSCHYEVVVTSEKSDTNWMMFAIGGGTALFTTVASIIVGCLHTRRRKRKAAKLKEFLQNADAENSQRLDKYYIQKSTKELTDKSQFDVKTQVVGKPQTDEVDLLANDYMRKKLADAVKEIQHDAADNQDYEEN